MTRNSPSPPVRDDNRLKRKADAIEGEPDVAVEEESSAAIDEEEESDLNVFEVQCPAKPPPLKALPGVTDLFTEEDTPTGAHLPITYVITPGSRWGLRRKYRNVRYQNVDFPLLSYIFVNRSDPPPPPPPENAPSDVVLEYQRENMWVGQIKEIRANSPEKVALRVFWLYWPEELPGGVRSYHGQQELVMSNHAEVIDAVTISGQADVSHWDEADEYDDRPMMALFWRQTYDLTKPAPKGKAALSTLRKHCKCGKEYNPDYTMVKCPNEDCGHWTHQACIEDDLLQDFGVLLEKNSLQKHLDRRALAFTEAQNAQERSLGETIAMGAEAATSAFRHVMAVIEGAEPAGTAVAPEPRLPPTPTSPKKRGRPRKSLGKQKTKFEERIQVKVRTREKRGDRDGAVVAEVKLLPGKGSTADIKEWEIDVACLKCARSLN